MIFFLFFNWSDGTFVLEISAPKYHSRENNILLEKHSNIFCFGCISVHEHSRRLIFFLKDAPLHTLLELRNQIFIGLFEI